MSDLRVNERELHHLVSESELRNRVAWALRSHLCETTQPDLYKAILDTMTASHAAEAVAEKVTLLQTKTSEILAHPGLSSNYTAWSPPYTHRNRKRELVVTNLAPGFLRLGEQGNKRIVTKGARPKAKVFVGLYWSKAPMLTLEEAKARVEQRDDALMTLTYYNTTISIEDWLRGSRVVDGGLASSRNCDVACINCAKETAVGDPKTEWDIRGPDHNAVVLPDGCVYTLRPLKAGVGLGSL